MKTIDGRESAITRRWLSYPIALNNIEDVIETRVQEILRARPDWTRDGPHVIKVVAEYSQFLSQREPDDQFWFFRSPPETWQHLVGRAGYVILREVAGELRVVAEYLTVMN